MKHQMFLSFLFLMTTLLLTTGCQKEKCIEQQIDPTCFCTEEYNPVIGCNGKIYNNPSYAKCAGVSYTPYVCDIAPSED